MLQMFYLRVKPQDDFTEVKCSSNVFLELGIKDEVYKAALSISDDNDFESHMKRPANS